MNKFEELILKYEDVRILEKESNIIEKSICLLNILTEKTSEMNKLEENNSMLLSKI